MKLLLAVVIPLFSLAACTGDDPKDKSADNGGDDTSGEETAPVDRDGDGYAADDDCDESDAGTHVGATEACDGVDNDCDGETDEGLATSSYYADGDADGYGAGVAVEACEAPTGTVSVAGDCADDDADVHPGAAEECDGIDNDCSGVVDDGSAAPRTWYADDDRDGYGAGAGTEACTPPEGMVADRSDCDDTDDQIHPAADELCNGVDDDCDGTVDDGAVDGVAYYTDADRDGYGAGSPIAACGQPAGTVLNDDDCDDARSAVNPGAIELCNTLDDDCDGRVDEDAADVSAWYADTDRDGYGAGSATEACSAPAGYVASNTDCDDSERTVNPGASEICNSVDDDCDGSVDEDATDAYVLYPDADGDSYGSTTGMVRSCDALAGYTTSTGDCDDAEDAVHPEATEVCNGVDDDCNGTADGSDATDAVTVWPDVDRDGYGAGRASVTCTVGAGFVTNDEDCDDAARAVNPAAEEVCDDVDNDCDGETDEDSAVDAVYGYADEDRDGFGTPDDYDLRCDGVGNALDCDDADATEPQVVDAATTATAPDGTIAAPWATIQDGIDAADECVLVAGGVYTENINFRGKDVLVRSQDGADATLIDGGGGGAVATFAAGEGAGAELRGFTLTNGRGHSETTTTTSSCGSSTTCTDHYVTLCGGGLYIDGATPSLGDLIVLGNNLSVPADYTSGTDSYYFYSFGGGLCLLNASLVLNDVDLWENYALDGGGAYIDSTAELSLRQSTVVANTAEFGGGFEVDGGTLQLANVLLAWNEASDGGGGAYVVDGSFSATNVTFGECDAVSGGGIYGTGAASLALVNSIAYGADTGVGILVGSGTTYSGSYSDVYGNAGGEYSGVSDPTGASGNVSSDPAFTNVTADGDYTNDDWSLGAGSSCVDRGNPAGVYEDADGSRNDMGAFGGPEGSGW